jgi:hypothetical protein
VRIRITPGSCKTPWIMTVVDEESFEPEEVRTWKEAILEDDVH